MAARGRARPDVRHLHVAELPQRDPARPGWSRRLGIEKARWLAPVDPPPAVLRPACTAEDLKAIDDRILAGYEAATKAFSFTPGDDREQQLGRRRRAFRVGQAAPGQRPAPAIALPSLRYLIHLNAPGWNVIGSGEPALPGVAIGHNDRIAWGFTIIGTDQADFFVEELHPQKPEEYRVGDRWEKMTESSARRSP